MTTESRRVVFDGPTALGWQTIFEDDEIELNNGFSGIAFYSNKYTPENQLQSEITIRLPDYNYGSDPENCHSWNSSRLLSVKSKTRVVKKSGFGQWFSKCST